MATNVSTARAKIKLIRHPNCARARQWKESPASDVKTPPGEKPSLAGTRTTRRYGLAATGAGGLTQITGVQNLRFNRSSIRRIPRACLMERARRFL